MRVSSAYGLASTSPNMKPIQHVWNCRQRRIAASNVQCGTRESLESELVLDRGMKLI